MIAPLLSHVQKFILLTLDEQETIKQYVQYLTAKKKQYLFSEGDVCNAQYFVIEGCLRMYFIKDSGVEQIVQFGIDNWWISDYTSLTSATSSQFYLQAVQPSKLIVLKKDKQEELFERIPKLESYFRRIYQRAYAAAQTRQIYFSDLSGEEKYHHFASRFPDFIQRIPQYMLASYLGFTPEFLSKIRAKR
jgi:CRP-like cAMP-binding protein